MVCLRLVWLDWGVGVGKCVEGLTDGCGDERCCLVQDEGMRTAGRKGSAYPSESWGEGGMSDGRMSLIGLRMENADGEDMRVEQRQSSIRYLFEMDGSERPPCPYAQRDSRGNRKLIFI